MIRTATEEEKENYKRIFQKEFEKRKRDQLAGGISPDGHYIRLHDRQSYK